MNVTACKANCRETQPFYLLTDEARPLQQVVDDAVRVQHQPPEDGDDRRRKDPRQDVDNPEHGTGKRTYQLGIEQHGEGEAEDQMDDDAHQREVERVAERRLEDAIRQNLDVVRRPHEHRVLVHNDVVHHRVIDNHPDG